MFNRRRYFIVCFCAPILFGNVYASEGLAGTTVFDFLKIPFNASQAASAGIGIFDTKTAAVNPALLPFCGRISLSASYSLYFQDTSFNSFSITVPLKNGSDGINISYAGFDYGKMEGYVEDGSGGYAANGVFTAADAFIGASYGRIITYDVCAGVNFKYVRQTIDDGETAGFTLSAAGIYMSDKTWYLAGGLDNAGPPADGYPMPSSAYVAFTDKPEEFDSMLVYGLEFRCFFDAVMQLKASCEFNYEQMFFARLGYNLHLNNDNKFLGEWYGKNLSAGFGVEYGFFVFDYAWMPFGDLGNVNMISLQVNF